MSFIRKFKIPENLSLLTTFVIGFATHLFGMVNVLHNVDDIVVLPEGSGVGITSGRWFLTILDGLFAKFGITYNLPYVNAFLFILFIAVSVKYIVRILEIKSPVSAVLIGAIFVAFPSATGTLLFRYTAVLYGIAMLCAVMAVWCVKKYKYGIVASILLLACSMGIYQAYVPVAIGLMVIVSLKAALAEKSNVKDIVKQGVKYISTLLMGVAVYFASLKICLHLFQTQLSTYQGVDQMGAIKLSELPSLLLRALADFFGIAFNDYKGISQTPVIRLGILLLAFVSVGLIVYIIKANKKKWDSILLIALLCLIFPFAVNFIVIMCPTSDIHTLMVYAFALIFTVPFVLMELAEPVCASGKMVSICKHYAKKSVVLVSLVIFLSYAYLANLNYTQLYHTNRKTENYLSSFVTQVRMTEGFDTAMQWAFIGDEFQDPLFRDNWDWVPKFVSDTTATYLVNSYSRIHWIKNCFGYNVPLVDGAQLEELEKNTAVKDMPCFPNDGAIRIINGVVVIKLENID